MAVSHSSTLPSFPRHLHARMRAHTHTHTEPSRASLEMETATLVFVLQFTESFSRTFSLQRPALRKPLLMDASVFTGCSTKYIHSN